MDFVKNTQYPVQPVALYITEHNARTQDGWGTVLINSNVEVDSIKIHFVNV